jgi:hypothetical protein
MCFHEPDVFFQPRHYLAEVLGQGCSMHASRTGGSGGHRTNIILGKELGEFGDGILPATGAAAMIEPRI